MMGQKVADHGREANSRRRPEIRKFPNFPSRPPFFS
jgi:hypothetical protein